MNISDKNDFIALTITCENQDYIFAVPIENIDAIISPNMNIPYAVFPNAPEYVICVMTPYGDQPITIINLLNLFGFSFNPETADVIVSIIFSKQKIGVPAQSARIVSACSDELLDNPITGAKLFVQGETKYFVLDIPRLYDYICNTEK